MSRKIVFKNNNMLKVHYQGNFVHCPTIHKKANSNDM